MTVPPLYGLVRVLGVEVTIQGGVQNEMTGYPTALLRALSLPIQQVLKPTSPSAHIQGVHQSNGEGEELLLGGTGC